MLSEERLAEIREWCVSVQYLSDERGLLAGHYVEPLLTELERLRAVVEAARILRSTKWDYHLPHGEKTESDVREAEYALWLTLAELDKGGA